MIIIFIFSYIFFVNQLILIQSAQDLNQEIKKHLQVNNDLDQFMQIISDDIYNKLTGTFVAIGNWGSEDLLLLRRIQTSSKPIFLLDIKSNHLQKYTRFSPFTKINKTVAETKVYPSSIITIVISSSVVFRKLLNDFKRSIWWNHEAYFLIINTNYENGCQFASQFLEIVWQFNVLSAIYFCIDKESKYFMYTFNPYDRVGTDFWQVSYVNHSVDNYWTMLEHSFNKSSLNGVTLSLNDWDLDRTKNLNRFKINIGTREIKVLVPPGPVLREISNDACIIDLILNKLNASYIFKSYTEYGANTKSGPLGSLKDIESGALNVLTTVILLRDIWKIQTYPREFNSLCLITPTNTVIHSLATFVAQDLPIFAAVSVVSIIVINNVFRYSISKTFLEFIRLLTSGSLIDIATRWRDNFFLFSITFLICATNFHLQSSLTTYKIVPGAVRQINSLDDLIGSDLELVGEETHREFIYREEVLDKFKIANEFECSRDIVAGKEKACVIYCTAFRVTNDKIHVHEAEETLAIRPSSFVLSVDWPLYSKFNLILSYIVEAGIYQQLRITYQAMKWNRSKIDKVFQSAKFEELKFAFSFLLIGCSLAISIFLVEMFVHTIKKFKM